MSLSHISDYKKLILLSLSLSVSLRKWLSLTANLTSKILSVHRNYTGEKVPTLLENIPTQGPEFSSGGSAPAEEISRTL